MAELEREGRRFVVATVVRTHGSTPQVVGSRLIIDDLGRLTGTLGGGCVEGDAILEARRLLTEGGSSLRAYDLTEPIAWDTGMVCGGTMWIHIVPGRDAVDVLRPAEIPPEESELASAAGRTRGGGAPRATNKDDQRKLDRPLALGTFLTIADRTVTAASHTLIEDRPFENFGIGGTPLSDRALAGVQDAFDRGVPRVVPLADGVELLIEPIIAKPHLVIAGGGHVALALAQMARLLDFDITVIEDREAFASAERFPGIDVRHGDIAPTLTEMPIDWNSFIIVATRGHKMDAHCVRAAAGTGARYVGLLGSRRKTVLIAKMLRAEGISEDRLRSIHAPIGLDLGGRTPAEIALSILAEISQERFGGTGKSLSQRTT
jgi:xanthine dehydrogenase accessory factor